MKTTENYYRVTAGSPTAEKIADFWKKRKEQLEARVAFAAEVGATGLLAGPTSISGFTFEKDEPPKGWMRSKAHSKAWLPTRRSKEGRALRERMGRYPMADARSFTHSEKYLGVDNFIMQDLTIQYITPISLGDIDVLEVPELALTSGAWEPGTDVTKLKTSEYYQLVEEHAPTD